MKLSYGLPAALIGAAIVLVQPQIASALLVNEVQAIAEEITVLIPGKNPNSGKSAGNGSGAIIAKEGNTYTVLTANHVVCKPSGPESCQFSYELKIVTRDGKEYAVNNSTVKKLPGVDLAVLQFTSDKNYRVAKLANYDPKLRSEQQVRFPSGQVVRQYGQFVFASGWPGVNGRDIQKLAYRFSVGRFLPPDKVVGFKIRPIEEGYEAVYTSITYPGMSGGPVLDTDGRVIAIHGQNEGERVTDESSGKPIRVQIGYSLSIPISKFLSLAPQAGIQLSLNVENNPPAELTPDQVESIGTQYVLAWIAEQSSAENNTAVYWANKGNQHWRSLEIPQALDAYDKALKIDPTFYPVWYGKGLVKTFRAEYEEANVAYGKAVEILDQKIAAGTDLQTVKGWVQNLQKQIQPFLANAAGSQTPAFNVTPPMPTTPPATPTPAAQPTTPAPATSPSQPQPLW